MNNKKTNISSTAIHELLKRNKEFKLINTHNNYYIINTGDFLGLYHRNGTEIISGLTNIFFNEKRNLFILNDDGKLGLFNLWSGSNGSSDTIDGELLLPSFNLLFFSNRKVPYWSHKYIGCIKENKLSFWDQFQNSPLKKIKLSKKSRIVESVDNMFGVLDESFEILLPFIYRSYKKTDFPRSSSLYGSYLFEFEENNQVKYHLISQSFEIIRELDEIKMISKNLILIKQGNQVGYCDSNLNWIKGLENLDNDDWLKKELYVGTIWIYKKNGLYGFIDLKGKIKSTPIYSNIEKYGPFFEVINHEGLHGFFNEKLKLIIPFEYTYIADHIDFDEEFLKNRDDYEKDIFPLYTSSIFAINDFTKRISLFNTSGKILYEFNSDETEDDLSLNFCPENPKVLNYSVKGKIIFSTDFLGRIVDPTKPTNCQSIVILDYPDYFFFITDKVFDSNNRNCQVRRSVLVSEMKKQKIHSPYHHYTDYRIEIIKQNKYGEEWVLGTGLH